MCPFSTMETLLICLGLNIFIPVFASFQIGTEEENPFLSLVNDELYVDKSGFIKVFHGHSDPVFFTAPYGFGKTVNLNMLKAFYEINVDEHGKRFKREDTNNFKAFDTLKNNKERVNPTIMEDAHFFNAHFGAYPVVHISFETLDVSNYNAFTNSFFQLVKSMVHNSSYYRLVRKNIGSDHNETHLVHLDKILSNPQVHAKEPLGLRLWTLILKSFFEKACVILIDEIDAPVLSVISQLASESEKIFNTIKEFLSLPLKDDLAVKKIFMTGSVRLAGTYLLQGVTKHYPFTINAEFTQFFGFNELELKYLLRHETEHKNKSRGPEDQIHSYYSGYRLPDTNTRIFNPYSVCTYLMTRTLRPYWSASSKPSLSYSLFTEKFMRDFLDSCIQGDDFIILSYGPADTLRYEDIFILRKIFHPAVSKTKLDNTEIVYLKSFLFELGYFTVREKAGDCLRVGIPNQEIRDILIRYREKSE